jgi:Co/Zn/Cd efflux system component
VVGGYLAGSLAVMTDAAHLLSDFVGFLVSLVAIWLGRRTPTRRFSFGYCRAGMYCSQFRVSKLHVFRIINVLCEKLLEVSQHNGTCKT